MADTDLLDYAGLKSYDSKIKPFMHNRQMTKSAPSVQFYPAPESELEPIVDFLFTETPPASGAKSPSNPSTIAGVSSAKISLLGKNLLAYDFSSAGVPDGTSKTTNGITVTNDDGVYSFSSGTASARANFYITNRTTEQNALRIPAGTYTLSGFTAPSGAPEGTCLRLQLTDNINSGNLKDVSCTDGSVTFTTDRARYCSVYIRIDVGTVVPAGFTCSPQLEAGAEATAFESSSVAAHTVSLGNIYYGGSVNFKTGEMTETWTSIPMTQLAPQVATWISVDAGLIAFALRTSNSGTQYAPDGKYGTTADRGLWVCNGLINTSVETSGHGERFYVSTSTSAIIVIVQETRLDYSGAADPSNPTSAEKNSALFALATAEGWTVTYPLATPQTVQLTPTQVLSLAQADPYVPQVNTVYTDQQGVRVGWQRIDIDSILARLDAIEAQLDG